MKAPDCVIEQEKRLYDALSEDKNAVISPSKLVKALGPGLSEQAIRNAAFEGILPFGFGHRSSIKGSKHVAIPKAAVWRWFQGNIMKYEDD